MLYFFSPARAVLSAILREEYLTSAVRTEEGDKAGSNQPPARDLVHFKLQLTPDFLISYLENTSCRSTRCRSPYLRRVESSRPAFSTSSVQNSRAKAFEVYVSIQIRQSACHFKTPIPARDRCLQRS